MLQFASLTDVHWPMSGEVVLMALLGGLGTIFGPVVGAFIVIAMQNYLAQVRPVGHGHPGRDLRGLRAAVSRRGIVGELGASAIDTTVKVTTTPPSRVKARRHRAMSA